jgi:hypothetical protein
MDTVDINYIFYGQPGSRKLVEYETDTPQENDSVFLINTKALPTEFGAFLTEVGVPKAEEWSTVPPQAGTGSGTSPTGKKSGTSQARTRGGASPTGTGSGVPQTEVNFPSLMAGWELDVVNSKVSFCFEEDKNKIEIKVKQKIGITGKYCFTKYVFDNIRKTLEKLTYEEMLNLGFGGKLGEKKDYVTRLEEFVKCMNGEGGGKYEEEFNTLIEEALCIMAAKTAISDPYIQERTFYMNSKASYREVFVTDGTNPKSISRLELCGAKVGEVYSPGAKIGNRFYSADGVYFSTLISEAVPVKKYAVLRGPGMDPNASLPDIVHTIYREYHRDKPGSAVTGSEPKTPAIMETHPH